MTLSSENLTSLAQQAVIAATRAGEIICSSSDKTIKVLSKPGGSTLAAQVLTEVDIQAERVIIESLQASCDAFDLGILSEEQEDDGSRLRKAFFWCIDPIDGTLSFIEQQPGYAVSIGLVSQSGEAIIGVVYDPVSETLYQSVKGQGVMRNEQRWVLDQSGSFKGRPLTLVCDRSLQEKPFYLQLLRQFEGIASDAGCSGLSIRHDGGAVMNSCWTLENAPACYFKLPKREQGGGSLWDFSATVSLYNEIGASATDFKGQPLNLNHPGTTYMNDYGVIFTTHHLLTVLIQKQLHRFHSVDDPSLS